MCVCVRVCAIPPEVSFLSTVQLLVNVTPCPQRSPCQGRAGMLAMDGMEEGRREDKEPLEDGGGCSGEKDEGEGRDR